MKARGATNVTLVPIPGANHFFANELDLLMKSVDDYLDMRLATDPVKPPVLR